VSWHPWFAEQRLTWSRRPGVRWLRIPALVLLALFVLLPIVASAASFGPVPVAAAEASLRMFARWPMMISLLLAMLVGMGLRRRVLALAHELHTGWWAAAPVPPRQSRQALLVFGIGLALVVLFACTAALTLVAIVARRFDLVGAALIVVSAGVGMGAALGLIGLPARTRPSGSRLPSRRRQAALTITGLGDPCLPWLFDWQRRTALSRWRQGGNAWLAGVLLLAMPAGVAPSTILGLMLMVLSLAWMAVVLRAAAEVTRESTKLLQTAPVPRRRILIAALRYPAFALACALTWALAGACLCDAVTGLMTAWCVALTVLSLPALHSLLPLHRRSP
jgi:hypothetical protein